MLVHMCQQLMGNMKLMGGPPTMAQNQTASMIGGRVREKELLAIELNMQHHLYIALHGRCWCTSANN
jgi:hypothetical protein